MNRTTIPLYEGTQNAIRYVLNKEKESTQTKKREDHVNRPTAGGWRRAFSEQKQRRKEGMSEKAQPRGVVEIFHRTHPTYAETVTIEKNEEIAAAAPAEPVVLLAGVTSSIVAAEARGLRTPAAHMKSKYPVEAPCSRTNLEASRPRLYLVYAINVDLSHAFETLCYCCSAGHPITMTRGVVQRVSHNTKTHSSSSVSYNMVVPGTLSYCTSLHITQ